SPRCAVLCPGWDVASQLGWSRHRGWPLQSRLWSGVRLGGERGRSRNGLRSSLRQARTGSPSARGQRIWRPTSAPGAPFRCAWTAPGDSTWSNTHAIVSRFTSVFDVECSCTAYLFSRAYKLGITSFPSCILSLYTPYSPTSFFPPGVRSRTDGDGDS